MEIWSSPDMRSRTAPAISATLTPRSEASGAVDLTCNSGLLRFRLARTSAMDGSSIICMLRRFAVLDQLPVVGSEQLRTDRRESVTAPEDVREGHARPCTDSIAPTIARTSWPMVMMSARSFVGFSRTVTLAIVTRSMKPIALRHDGQYAVDLFDLAGHLE